jgi:hypothetical protein
MKGWIVMTSTFKQQQIDYLPGQGLPPLERVDVSTLHTSSPTGLTARSGGGQANATPITTKIAYVTLVQADHDSVLLPVSTQGVELTVINAGGHILDVYGRDNDTINAIAATNPFTGMAAGKTARFTCPVEGKWFALLTA